MGESMWRRPVTELSSYPTELDAHVTLTDQRRIRLRAFHSREGRPIRVLPERLSPRTRYLRFLSPIPTLPDALVRRLAWVDYRRRLAVVAEDEAAGGAGEAGFRPLRRHHRDGQLDHPTAARSYWPGRRQPHEPRCI